VLPFKNWVNAIVLAKQPSLPAVNAAVCALHEAGQRVFNASVQIIDMLRKKHIIKVLSTSSDVGSIATNHWIAPYIIGYRDRTSMYNAQETLLGLSKALLFLRAVYKRDGVILLVNTNSEHSKLVKKTATLTRQPYVNEFWTGGLLTNWEQVKYSVQSYSKFELFFAKIVEEGTLVFPKYNKARKRFVGVQHIEKIPDALVLFQATNTFRHIIEESNQVNTPVIAFIDAYSPKVSVDYPIPVNTDSKAFAHLFCKLFVKLCTSDTLVGRRPTR
jgi:ribosomal protein S2